MTLFHADGFQHYGDTSELYQIYQSDTQGASQSANPRLTSVASTQRGARTGTYYLNFQSDFTNHNFPGHLAWTFPSFQTKVVLCMALRHNRIGDSLGETPLRVILKDGTQISAGFNGLQQYILQVNGTTVVESNPRVFQTATWNWLELLVDTDNQRCELRVNNAVVATYSGTSIPLAGKCAQWYANSQGAQDYDVCDLVLVTGNTYPGDHRCFTILPNDDTAQHAWSITGANKGSDAINNIPVDPTQFISSHNAGDVSTFNHDPLPDNALTVLGLAFYTKSKKSDAGDCAIAVGLTTGGQTALAAARPQVTVLTWNEDIVSTNPATNTAYTPNDVNTGQLTIKRTL